MFVDSPTKRVRKQDKENNTKVKYFIFIQLYQKETEIFIKLFLKNKTNKANCHSITISK